MSRREACLPTISSSRSVRAISAEIGPALQSDGHPAWFLFQRLPYARGATDEAVVLLTMRTIPKAAAFVIRCKIGSQPELLLFTHIDHPSVPHQVLGGGIEPGEQPYAAALRELFEEAGLTPLSLLRFIGVSTAPAHLETDAQVERHCYLFDGEGLPDQWIHHVTGAGDDRNLRFEYRWHPAGALPPLAGSQGHFLSADAIPELFPAVRSPDARPSRSFPTLS